MSGFNRTSLPNFVPAHVHVFGMTNYPYPYMPVCGVQGFHMIRSSVLWLSTWGLGGVDGTSPNMATALRHKEDRSQWFPEGWKRNVHPFDHSSLSRSFRNTGLDSPQGIKRENRQF